MLLGFPVGLCDLLVHVVEVIHPCYPLKNAMANEFNSGYSCENDTHTEICLGKILGRNSYRSFKLNNGVLGKKNNFKHF